MQLRNKGLTLIEVLMGLGIIIILAAIVVPNLNSFKNIQALKNSSEEVNALLNKAKSNTITSLKSSNYGVHFQSDKVVLFVGNVYNSSDSANEVVTLDSRVEIPSSGGINIAGGADVIFERLSGNTQNSGKIILQLKSDQTKQKNIIINKVGAISLN